MKPTKIVEVAAPFGVGVSMANRGRRVAVEVAETARRAKGVVVPTPKIFAVSFQKNSLLPDTTAVFVQKVT